MFYILKTDLTNDYSVNYGVFDDKQRAKDFVNAQTQYDDVIYEIKPVENVYQEHGFLNRDDYLQMLAFDYDIDEDKVYELASIHGEEEDFDALLTLLDDYVTMLEIL